MKGIVVVSTISSSLVAACATNIHPPSEPVVRSKVPLSKFQTVAMMPLTVQKTEGDAGDQKAVAQIGSQLRSCMRNVFSRFG